MQVVDHEKRGLYDPRFEHDNCGIGAIVNIKGNKTHDTVSGALDIVEKLEHRAGKDAEGKTGDGEMCIRDRLYVDQGIIAGCAGGGFENILSLIHI